MDHSAINLRPYLLGCLPPAERESVDIQVIADEHFGEAVALAEHDLVEDYIDGMLSDEEVAAFEQSYLWSEERRTLVTDLREIKKVARAVQRSTATTARAVREKSRPRRVMSLIFRPTLAFGALMLAVILSLVALQTFFARKQSRLEAEYSQLNRPPSMNAGYRLTDSAIRLAAGNLRGTTGAAARRHDDLPDRVPFTLVLPLGGADAGLFKLDVKRGLTDVFSLNDVTGYSVAGSGEITILLPKSLLTPGTYRFVLSRDGDGVIADYAFAVN